MSNLVPAGFGSLAPVFGERKKNNDLSAGISAGFAVISYRGGKWRIKHRKEEHLLMRPDGDPMTSIELVLVKASSQIAKQFYKDGYKDGQNEAPDCASNNGVTPMPGCKAKQANACAACPQNAWGSRITAAGKQGKACSDSRRVAVVPLNDLRNETFGGPMLLRVPAASLTSLADYGNRMDALGFPYEAIGTRISFDPAATYPKMVFKEIRALEADEAVFIRELQDDPRISRILSEGTEFSEQPVAIAAGPNFDAPTPEVKAEPAPAPVKREYKKKAAAPAPAPVATPEPADEPEVEALTGTSFDDELDAQMNALLGKAH